MSEQAVQSIAAFVLLFLGATALQHLLMVRLYKRVFIKLKLVPLIGDAFDRPAVIIHELFGHLIPALISGSRIIGVDLQEEKGQVAVKYEKNLFGMASVFLSAFGPTFILPLLFIALYAYMNSSDIIWAVMEGDPVGKSIAMLSDISMLNELKDVLLLYAAVVIVPGAASSSGDVKSAVSFVKGARGIVFVWSVIGLLILYISYIMGFELSGYGIAIVLNSLGAYVVMYVLAALALPVIVDGWMKKGYIEAAVVFAAALIALKLAVPLFEYPLIVGLVCSNAVLALKRLKRK